MATLRIKPVPTPEQVLARMRVGVRYQGYQFERKFNCKILSMTALLDQMVEDGLLQAGYLELRRSYYIDAVPEIKPVEIPGRYVPPRKELGIYDNRVHQRMCEGARNSLTGVV